MSVIWEVYLWRVTGKNIRNNSGNCHIEGTDQIMMSPKSEYMYLISNTVQTHFTKFAHLLPHLHLQMLVYSNPIWSPLMRLRCNGRQKVKESITSLLFLAFLKIFRKKKNDLIVYTRFILYNIYWLTRFSYMTSSVFAACAQLTHTVATIGMKLKDQACFFFNLVHRPSVGIWRVNTSTRSKYHYLII